MGYRQLTQVQRYQIFAYLETGISQRQIAKAIGVHSSTISREIKHNGLPRGYPNWQVISADALPGK
ncbi:Integrase core domain protein [Halomonas sp. R57-5]|nr:MULTISPECIES: helix-turn-helix domain-containing protein [unclassified Halomonas]CEP36832.1 Integrase core domain protein [Halomonas sp. R57-5]